MMARLTQVELKQILKQLGKMSAKDRKKIEAGLAGKKKKKVTDSNPEIPGAARGKKVKERSVWERPFLICQKNV